MRFLVHLKSRKVPELACSISIPADFPSRRDLLEDEWEVLIKSSDLKIHASVQDLNTWVTKIRLSYVESYQVNKYLYLLLIPVAICSNMTRRTLVPYLQMVSIERDCLTRYF